MSKYRIVTKENCSGDKTFYPEKRVWGFWCELSCSADGLSSRETALAAIARHKSYKKMTTTTSETVEYVE